MEHVQEPSFDSQPGEQPAPFVFPPKFVKPEQPAGNVWLKSLTSLALYLILGYYIFHSFTMLLIITAIVIFHEMGHFAAMKAFRYKDLGIFFIPLLGAYVSGTKREVSQRESAIILLAGPLPGIIVGIVFYLLWQNNPDLSIAGESYYRVSLLLILLNVINLLPVYPLDGGQLLNRVFLDEESWISKLFIILSCLLMVWIAWQSDWKLAPLLIFPVLMITRLFSDAKFTPVDKRIEQEGINADVAYEQLPDEDYWKIRNILIAEHPAFKEIKPTPPYEYDAKEEKVMLTIQSLLHRHLIQDLPLIGKILVALVWIAAFMAPFFLDMYDGILATFGF